MSPLSAASETAGSRTDESLAIEADDVRVTYADGTRAVRGVSFDVERGECFGIVGPNGAGKTTAIRTLVTLLYPTAGSVTVNGFDVRSDPRRVRESIGYMAQYASVDEELTARENLRFACEAHGVPAADRDERIDALLAIVGLEDVADTRAAAVSGGTKKRLDAATALVHRPPVVFLDEPTTGLDPEARLGLWNYVERLTEAGTTVVLTTQYLEEADRLCDRLAVLEDGRIVATDTPAALKSRVGGDVLTLRLADAAQQRIERAARVVRETDAVDAATIERTDDGLAVASENARGGGHDLLVALHEAGIRVAGFDVRSPTLDDVFLSLTGTQADSSTGAQDDSPTGTGHDGLHRAPTATEEGSR